MVIFDEASGISPKIYEAALGAMAGGHVVRFVLIGNPTVNSGRFYDAFKDPTFNKIRISAHDVPNVRERRQVVPGLITHEWVDEMAIKYGEESDIYKVRVLGEFPRNAAHPGSGHSRPKPASSGAVQTTVRWLPRTLRFSLVRPA